MSNLPLQSAVIHNEDNDEQTNTTTNKLSPLNSRITSRLIMKRQQHIETKIANNQACDEIHDLQPKYYAIKKTNTNDNSYIKTSKQNFSSKLNSSHELMQGNYYDRTRFDIDYSSPSSSSSNHQSDPVQIDINVEDYKKKCTPVSTSENSSNKDRSNSPPFGDTSESIQQNIAQSAGRLLELNKTQHYHKNSMKNSTKSHERAAINYFPNDNDTKQRSSSPSSSSDCSTDDSSISNKCQEDDEKTNIPYEKLLNDEDDDDNELIEQPKKLLTESSTLLNKNLSQTYGTQLTTNERSKYLPNNGYNSHGSSVTTKSSSDNSGSIRTNSGSDNDEESDEEPYNNSTLSNNSPSTPQINDSSIKSFNKSNDIRYLYSNEQNNHQLRRSNPINSEQTNKSDAQHRQVNRLKHCPNDDPNGNNNKLNSSTDYNGLHYPSKRSLQQSSTNQTNTLSSSSQQNRNHLEQNSNLSHNSSRQHQIGKKSKKRKQSQQQDIIRTELIPGHRGDRDVDELVMFIDGNSSKQIQNSVPLRLTDTNKPRLSSKLNSLNDPNSNKTSSRKKSRKSTKSISSINDNENKTTIDQDNQTTTTTSSHSIVDITNQSLIEQQNISTESHLNPIDVIDSTNTTNGDWFEQTQNTSNDIDSYYLSSSITNNLNSEIISEPFVTVTHRRRIVKERRQDNNNPISRSSRVLPPSSSSSTSNTNDKRRVPSTLQNGNVRSTIHQKYTNSSVTKEENTNPISSEPVPPPPPPSSIVNPVNDQSLEKQQSSPRLSSHSSSSSLSSLLKRQSKAPPVVFMNKSIDVELNDVSFGFDLDSIDSTTLNNLSDEINNNNNKLSTIEQDNDIINPLIPSSNEPIQSNEMSTQKNSTRKFQQRNNRGPHFYSGSDIRPQHHRNYPSQSIPQSSYIDPVLLFQYNQQRYQHLAYMNLLRAQYIPPQSQYIFLPTTYPTTTTVTNETDLDDETNQISTEQIQEPLLVYATPTGQLYYHPSTIKKTYTDSEQQQQQPQPATAPIPTVYTTAPTIYPSHYYYPSQIQHVIPSHPAYFQPITSPSLLIDTKSEQNDIDDVDIDDDYENSTKLYHQLHQQSSSDIMSNALQLVYSQQKRNAQTDRFNLDDLTAYLAMKWTDTVDHYVQGDSRILLVNEQ